MPPRHGETRAVLAEVKARARGPARILGAIIGPGLYLVLGSPLVVAVMRSMLVSFVFFEVYMSAYGRIYAPYLIHNG